MGGAEGVCPVEDGGTMGETPSRRSGSPPQRIRDPSHPSRAGKGGGMGRSVPRAQRHGLRAACGRGGRLVGEQG